MGIVCIPSVGEEARTTPQNNPGNVRTLHRNLLPIGAIDEDDVHVVLQPPQPPRITSKKTADGSAASDSEEEFQYQVTVILMHQCRIRETWTDCWLKRL